MKTWILAGALIAATSTAALADGYWVVGNNQTNSCDIVTSNPVLNISGPQYFSSGPYRSMDDAKQARSTIGQCPKVADAPPPPVADTPAPPPDDTPAPKPADE
jgi:hypothetical protein